MNSSRVCKGHSGAVLELWSSSGVYSDYLSQKYQTDTHHRDPMEDYNHNHAHGICHTDYKTHNTVEVHDLHFVLLADWDQYIQAFEYGRLQSMAWW